MNQGYIKLYRKIEENPIVCKDNEYFRVWHYLMYNASHKKHKIDFNGEGILLNPGQLITGRLALANKCNISESKAERILKRFEIEQQIEQQTCNRGRLITIVNWGKYQPDGDDSEQQSGQQPNNEWTTTEQLANTNNNVNNGINNISTTTNEADDTETRETEKKTLFEFMEETFSKIFNGLEQKIIDGWQDNDVTRYAIGQAALQGVSNVKYIDAILEAYKKENITTLEQAKEREKKFQEEKQRRKNNVDHSKKIQEPPSWFNQKFEEERIELSNEDRALIERVKNGT